MSRLAGKVSKSSNGPNNVRKTTVRMVETHLHKQKSAYDHWIQELCRDAEESAAERDRLKLKLNKLREDQKRKVMAKILKRLGNMQYYMAWATWHNAATRMGQVALENEILALRAELVENEKKADALEKEAEERAAEAARLAFGSATDSQKKLVGKILNKLCTGMARQAWKVWWKQAFYHKHCKILMAKILKRLYNSQVMKGFTQWKTIATKWDLIVKLQLKEKLIDELTELEKKAKEYAAEADRRSEEATLNAMKRKTGAQKDLITKILGKLTGNVILMGWNLWKKAYLYEKHCQQLLSRIFFKLINIKKFTGFRYWHHVCFDFEKDKAKVKQMLLKSQKDNLEETLRERAQQLKALQAEAARLLAMSQHNAAETNAVMQVSDQFAENLAIILDPKYLEKKNAMSYEEFEAEMNGTAPPSGAQPAQPAQPAAYGTPAGYGAPANFGNPYQQPVPWQQK